MPKANAVDMFLASWEPGTAAFETNQALKICLMGKLYFEQQYAKNLYGSQNFKKGYTSWGQEAKRIHNASASANN